MNGLKCYEHHILNDVVLRLFKIFNAKVRIDSHFVKNCEQNGKEK